MLYLCSSSEIQALKLESVLDLRVLKKTCRREADNLDIELRQTSSRQKAAMMNRTNPEGTSSSEDVRETLAKCTCNLSFADSSITASEAVWGLVTCTDWYRNSVI